MTDVALRSIPIAREASAFSDGKGRFLFITFGHRRLVSLWDAPRPQTLW